MEQKEDHLEFNQKVKYQYEGEGKILEVLNFGEAEEVMIRELYRIIIMKENQVKYKYFTSN